MEKKNTNNLFLVQATCFIHANKTNLAKKILDKAT